MVLMVLIQMLSLLLSTPLCRRRAPFSPLKAEDTERFCQERCAKTPRPRRQGRGAKLDAPATVLRTPYCVVKS
jgi:hypothetical protein